MNDADLAKFRDRIKLNHIAVVDTDNSPVTPYTQDIPVTARESLLKSLREQIYEDYGALDVHTVAAGSTNDHIDMAYQCVDEEADDFEYQVIKCIRGILGILGVDDMPIFNRNRISNQKERTEMVMLAANYLMCTAIALLNIGSFSYGGKALPITLGLGSFNGLVYLLSFLLLQMNVKRNGIVLSASFMKLGLLVPVVASVLVFGEAPGSAKLLGFFVALIAIVLINHQPGASQNATFKAGLLLLLLTSGCADVMSKVFQEVSDPAHAPLFLLCTFGGALVLCLLLVLRRKERPGKAEILFGFLISIPNYYSSRFLLRCLESVDAVVAYPCYNAGTILLTTLLGVLLFKERLTRKQWLAMGIILIALVLLNL